MRQVLGFCSVHFTSIAATHGKFCSSVPLAVGLLQERNEQNFSITATHVLPCSSVPPAVVLLQERNEHKKENDVQNFLPVLRLTLSSSAPRSWCTN